MPRVTVQLPPALLASLDERVGDDGPFDSRGEAIRAALRRRATPPGVES